MKAFRLCLLGLFLWTAGAPAAPGSLEDFDRQRTEIDGLMLDLAAERPLQAPDHLKPPFVSLNPGLDLAQSLGRSRAALNHQAILESIQALETGDVAAAQQWRSRIDLPKYAGAVEGAVALARIGGNRAQLPPLARLITREYLQWQCTRVRQKNDSLVRSLQQDRLTPVLIAARMAEIQGLSEFPDEILDRAGLPKDSRPDSTSNLVSVLRELGASSARANQLIPAWRETLFSSLPNLLGPQDIERYQRLMAKLLKLVPIEYKSGVRDGEIVIPIEYREALSFTQQAAQIFSELRAPWQKEKAEALRQYGPELEEKFSLLEKSIQQKQSQDRIDRESSALLVLLQERFDVGLRKMGRSGDVVAESALEIRSLLGQSLAAARDGRWREAEELRLEAYTTFDIEIERRVLPRDPELALQAEQMFLDGGSRHAGIKSALDARKKGPDLERVYQQTLSLMEECVAVLKVGLSPRTVSFTAFTIVLREGLEAVVILAALLAGFRGPELAPSRRRLVTGAWLAVLASFVTFIIGNTIIQGLSRYGEILEAVVSFLAVIILFMVTNWVFHKIYWVEWNARLRQLSKKARESSGGTWEALSMVGIGFLTIYREGFETTLFMQSLILEGGWIPCLSGALVGLLVIGLLGYAVFVFGAKLPYRKLLVITGVLVVSIMVTFIGSTVRLFQIVGWLPVHPIEGLQLPLWTGTWLGLYPTWEGMIIPLLGLAYVAGCWLYSKWKNRRAKDLSPSAEEKDPALSRDAQ